VKPYCSGSCHDDGHRVDGRHEVLGLSRQEWVPVRLQKIAGSRALDRPQHLHSRPRVRRPARGPRAEDLVEIAEVVWPPPPCLSGSRRSSSQRSTRSPYCCAVGANELPEALGPRIGDRDRVEAALDHRGEDQLLGQPLLRRRPGPSAGTGPSGSAHRSTTARRYPVWNCSRKRRT